MAIIGPVYHGTTSYFDQFDPLKQDEMALFGPGFYFTDNKEVASGYAEAVDYKDRSFLTEEDLKDYLEDNPQMTVMKKWKGRKEGIGGIIPSYDQIWVRLFDSTKYRPHVKKIHLKVNNPFNVEKDRLSHEQLGKIGWKGFWGVNLNRIIDNRPDVAPQIREKLKSLGYDAITHAGGDRTGGKSHRVWIVFDQGQVLEGPQVASAFVSGLCRFLKNT